MATALVILAVLIVFILARIESHLADIKDAAEGVDWRAKQLHPLLKHEREDADAFYENDRNR